MTSLIAGAGGLFFLAVGLWALLAPASFYELVATYPPYNHHLLHDIGAFNIGLGAVLLGALVWRDALLVGLAGTALGSAAHAYAHWIDQHLGGSALDPILLTLLAAVLAGGAALRWRELRR